MNAASCVICGAVLQWSRIGRPPIFCGRRCRYRHERRARTVGRLSLWAAVARGRGDVQVAERFEARAAELEALPWRAARG
jgi:hypothetical protein